MGVVKLISIENIIGRFLKDYNIEDTTYVDDFPQWTQDAIEIMELSNYYTVQPTVKKVENYRCALPCNIESLCGIWIAEDNKIVTNVLGLNKLVIRNMPLIGHSFPQPQHRVAYATIDGNFIHTSFESGYIYIVYKGIPLDCNGLPMVPKGAKVAQALEYYYIKRMMLSGYKHPIFTYGDIEALWKQSYPAAANAVNWMDSNDLQEFKDMWTNPIIGDLNSNNNLV